VNLKPQDIVLLLKLVAMGEKPWSFNKMANDLGMSASEVHAAARRAVAARLAVKAADSIRPHLRNLEEFLLHGIQYVFVPELGGLTRGMPTAHAAPPPAGLFAEGIEPPPVWPDPEGPVRGSAFSPLYKSVPVAAKNDPALYALLVLVDALRGGRARERELARQVLKKRLSAMAGKEGEPMTSHRDRLVIGGELEVSRAAIRQLARRYHISRLELFGSAARGELRPDSDIDLLVEFEPGHAPSLWASRELHDDFSRLLGGRRVHFAPPEILRNPYRRRTIERDLKVLYEAA
jgi:predicted nucleotidyltransferase